MTVKTCSNNLMKVLYFTVILKRFKKFISVFEENNVADSSIKFVLLNTSETFWEWKLIIEQHL